MSVESHALQSKEFIRQSQRIMFALPKQVYAIDTAEET
jgi:hypothetical protein